MSGAAPEKNSMQKIAGPMGWLIGIVTGVVFIGMLYNGMSHGDHGDGHGAEHAEAADHGAEEAAH